MKSRSDFAQEVFRHLKNINIPVVVWKNLENINLLSSKATQVELDIFVERAYSSSFYKLINSLGFVKYQSAVASFPGIHHFYAACAEGWLHLNVYTSFVTGESQTKFYNLPLLIEWQNVNYKIGIPVLGDSEFLELFVIRTAIKFGSIISLIRTIIDLKDYSAELKYVLQCELTNTQLIDPVQIEFIVSKWKQRNYFSIFFRSLFIKFYLNRYARFGFVKRLIFRNVTLITRIINKLAYKRKRFRSENTGIIISVVGTDGSGKSSIVSFLSSRFAIFDLKVLSVGRQDGYKRYFKPFFSVLPFLVKKTSYNTTSIKLRSRTGFFSAIKAVMVARARFKVMRLASRCRDTGHVVILDRLPVTIKGAQDGPRIYGSSLITKFLEQVEKRYYESCYPPDLVLRLDVSLENAVLRNRRRVKVDKETDSEIAQRHELFSKSFFRGGRVLCIDANVSLIQLREDCLANVLKVW